MRSIDTSRRSGPRAGPVAAVMVLLLAACTAAPSGSATPGAADPTRDKLAQVKARGTLVLWTDPDYAPQSFAVAGATRAASTKCASNQLTAPEISGYDAETGKLVAEALGLEPCFIVTPFDAMIAGSWGDRWDVAWASGAITTGRMEKLYVTQPYYSTPANFFVKPDSPFQAPADLAGKRIGVCSGCTHQGYLERTLALPGVDLDFVVTDPVVVTYNTEPPGLRDTAAGEVDAFLCSEPVGLGAIAQGVELRELLSPAYTTFKTGYADRDASLAMGPFLDAVNAAVANLHATGKLEALSIRFFEKDYATAAATFELAGLQQEAR